MLTRLRVRGFKNLTDVDLWLGPFTCIAGVTGVGKSNILDAIAFLSALSSMPLVEAALSVRDENLRTGDIRSLFHRFGESFGKEMWFSVDMIIPRFGFDDLRQKAEASSTYLQYDLKLRYKDDLQSGETGRLEIAEEKLIHIKLEEASRRLGFPFSLEWKKTALHGHRTTPFISTDIDKPASTFIKIHQDGRAGATRKLSAANLPRTALSAMTAAETPTATLAKREMQSWKLLHLEPSSLRAPDIFNAPTNLGSYGSHLAATLYRMATQSPDGKRAVNSIDVYARVANRLSELINDVNQLEVERDEKRQLFTLYVAGSDKTRHPARSLSDGTLRFLALATLEEDRSTEELLCLEEPENGIHPKRIAAILRLLQDIAIDPGHAVDENNSLRQVLINTHSPLVVAQIPDDTLVVAVPKRIVNRGSSYTILTLSSLADTWRTDKAHMLSVARGHVSEYLSAIAPPPILLKETARPRHSKPVANREDLQMSLGTHDEPALYAAK